ncbi:MAG TPA: histone deacetylase [Tepidisphaeraceae bacterium]|jgi:acetoin utilization deacetylase AcuC-like enzyme|nr:histone deacetylase [Tepidisphaeraceae bacterium]
MPVAFVSDPCFVDHDTGPHHPERPDRIRAIHRALRQAKLIDSPDPFPDFQIDLGLLENPGIKLIEISPTPADEKYLSLVHTPQHINHIRQICAHGGGVLDQADTPVAANGFDMGLLSLGSALTACDAVMKGNASRAFSASRPPGHHAEPDRPMGFCLFSNIAIAARYMQQTYGLKKIAIVDFDVHHGNGTQAALEFDPSILFVSLHQHPATLYPGSGHAWETGIGPGRGFTMNLPFNPGDGDDEYLDAIQNRILPTLAQFHPELLMISAGFDAHRDDPLAQIQLSESGFEQITKQLVTSANQLCNGKIVSLLEGGYNLRALARSVVRHLIALSE